MSEGQDDGHVHKGDEVSIGEHAEDAPERVEIEGSPVEEEGDESQVYDIEDVDQKH